MIRCVLLLLLLIFLPATTHAETLAGVASVIDGDTIEIHGQRIRLLDMDAPESHQTCIDVGREPYRCGQRAALVLSDFLQQRTVSCDWAKRDKYKRLLGRCVAGGQDIGLWMVEQGWAVPYRNCKCEVYRDAAAKAQSQKQGIWAGKFQLPWEWRKAH